MKRFKQLIQSMPLNEQAFKSKKSTWKKYIDGNSEVSEILKFIFDGNSEVQISRKDLFVITEEKNLKYFIVAVILWGYPRGMRGNHFENLVLNIDSIVEALKEAKDGIPEWTIHYKKIEEIHGLGLSTYSKFLYFLNVKVEGYTALILDNRITNTFNERTFSEFIEIGKIRYDNAVSKYPLYLKIMDTLSEELHTDSGKLEMFIFEFGQNLKLK